MSRETMSIKNVHRWIFGGVIALLGAIIVVSAVSADNHWGSYEDCMADINDEDICGETFDVTPTPNRAPTVTINTSSKTVYGRSYVSLTAISSDPDDDSLSYSWSGFGTFSSSSSEDTTWRAPSDTVSVSV